MVSTSVLPIQHTATKQITHAPVGAPGWVGWRESTLTRAEELESLCDWLCQNNQERDCQALTAALPRHLEAVRQAAEAAKPWPMKLFRSGPLLERALSNLDAAEAFILNAATADYVLGQMPSLLRHVQCHLVPTDPRRQPRGLD